MKLKFLFTCMASFFLFTTCKKKVIEIVPVIDYENISIDDSADIKYFSFPTYDVGYAAGSKLYKTIDGGKNWTALSVSGNITGVEFINTNVGFCVVNGGLLKTTDGGTNWTYKLNSNFIAIAENGTIVTVRSGSGLCKVNSSRDTGNTFFQLSSLSLDGNLMGVRVLDNVGYIFDSQSYFDDAINGIDLIDTSKFVRLSVNANAYENPNDVYYKLGNGAAVGLQGCISNLGYNKAPNYYLAGFDRSYYGHTYAYNSIDGYDGLMVAVGYHTMATNLNINNEEPWNEVFDNKRNGFEQTFYRIRFLDKSTFIVSGNNGLIWRAKI